MGGYVGIMEKKMETTILQWDIYWGSWGSPLMAPVHDGTFNFQGTLISIDHHPLPFTLEPEDMPSVGWASLEEAFYLATHL